MTVGGSEAEAISKVAETYNRTGARDLAERLRAPFVMQGPLGSLLMSEPGGEGIPAAAWNVSEPQTVTRLHDLYRAAGADVLITNTFQASGPALKRDRISQSVAAVNRAAVDCARAAHGELVLGSMGPCGLEWTLEGTPEYRAARAAYREQAAALLAAGADGLLLETFTSIRDLDPALAGALDAADGMPVLVSFAIDDKGDLAGDHLNIEAAVMHAAKGGAASVGVNCCSIAAATAAVSRMRRATDLPLTVRPSAGLPHRDPDGAVAWDEDVEDIARAGAAWIGGGAAGIGGCCGTTPRTTCALADLLAGA